MQPSLTWEESQGIMWPIRCWHYLFSQEFLISVAGIRSNWIWLFFHAPKDTTLSGTLWTFWSCERVYLFHFWNENVIGHKPYLMKYLKYLMWHFDMQSVEPAMTHLTLVPLLVYPSFSEEYGWSVFAATERSILVHGMGSTRGRSRNISMLVS